MLTYEHQFLLTVAITLVPVTVYSWIVLTELLQLCRRHGGIPLSGVLQLHLTASLLKDITKMWLILKPAHSLGTYHTLWPATGYEVIKQSYVKRTTGIIYECAYAIFLCLALTMMVVVVMMVTGTFSAMM